MQYLHIKQLVSLGEKYYYDKYGQRNSCSSSPRQHVKNEMLGAMFIEDRKRDFRYSIGLTQKNLGDNL